MHENCIPMGMKKLLPYFALLLTIALASCEKVEEPQFKKLEGFGVKKLSLKETVIGFNATYFNPNNFGVSVKEASFDVYVDSMYLGKFTQSQEISVQKNANFSIPMEGKISLEKALLFNIPNMMGKEVGIKAQGIVKLGKAGVFITKNVDYQGRHKLDTDLLK